MSLMNGGKIDARLQAINVMQAMGWDINQYNRRPAWFDPLFEVKLKAEAKYQEVKTNENKS